MKWGTVSLTLAILAFACPTAGAQSSTDAEIRSLNERAVAAGAAAQNRECVA